MLPCVAVCCSVWQCLVVCCSALQCVSVCCSVLQRVPVCSSSRLPGQQQGRGVAVFCSVLQCVAVCCSLPDKAAVVWRCWCACSLRCSLACSSNLWGANGLSADCMPCTPRALACKFFVASPTRVSMRSRSLCVSSSAACAAGVDWISVWEHGSRLDPVSKSRLD